MYIYITKYIYIYIYLAAADNRGLAALRLYHTLPVLARSLGFASASCVSTFAHHACMHTQQQQGQRQRKRQQAAAAAAAAEQPRTKQGKTNPRLIKYYD